MRESGSVYYTGEADYQKGEQFNGGGFRNIPEETEWGAIRAFEPATGTVKWEFKLFTPPWAGVMSTAGNLVFGSTTEGQILALADRYGSEEAGGEATIPLRLTQSDLGDIVGASRERVNQVIVELKQRGYISVDPDHRIRVHDRRSLARYCR